VWVIEPGEPAGDGETIVAGRRGLFDWHLRVEGRSAHSGLHYWQGRSAVAAAAEWSSAASALSRREGGPTVNVARLVGGERDFVLDPAAGASLLGTARQLNVVPDLALAEGEARFLDLEDGEDIARRLSALTESTAARTDCRLTFDREATIPPVSPRAASRWSERAVELAARRGWRLEVERDRGGISFPNFLADPSAVPVLDGLGPVGGGMHTRAEYVSLVSLRRRVTLLADLLQADVESGGRA
jgi:glutamate carboxypeptidase